MKKFYRFILPLFGIFLITACTGKSLKGDLVNSTTNQDSVAEGTAHQRRYCEENNSAAKKAMQDNLDLLLAEEKAKEELKMVNQSPEAYQRVNIRIQSLALARQFALDRYNDAISKCMGN